MRHGACQPAVGTELRIPISAIQAAGKRAAGLTTQLLSFSRKAAVAPRILNLPDVITDSKKLISRLIGEDIKINLIFNPGPAWIMADPNQIDQVIMNLAVNARDAMPKGGTLTFETSFNRYQNTVVLRVSDTGYGMTEEVKSNIFEPFYTTKAHGKGTGLGLSVVDGVVQQTGGHIEVESSVGVGTTFRIHFPSVQAPNSTTTPQAMPVKGGSETILLVEDDEGVRELCKSVLESLGYKVLGASSSEDALARIEDPAVRLDLLITDVVMPQMSGCDMAHAVRKSRSEVRVVFVSGYSDEAIMRHGISHSADEFMQKPFSPWSLARKVREILDRTPSRI